MQKRLQSIRKERVDFFKCPDECVALLHGRIEVRQPYRGLRGQN